MVENLKNNSLTKIWQCLVCALLFLMIWATGHLIWLKIIIVLICLCVGLLYNNSQIVFEPWSTMWICSYILFNVFFMFTAFLNGNSSVFSLVTVRILEPLIFLFLISMINLEDYHFFKKAVKFFIFFLLVYSIIGFLSVNQLIPISSKYLPFVNNDFGGVLPFGLQKATSQNNQWLYFLIPCSIAMCFIENMENSKLFSLLSVLNFILSIVVTVITLKTALIIVFSISFVFSLVIKGYINKSRGITAKKFILFILLVCFVLLLFLIPSIRSFIFGTLIEKVKISLGLSAVQVNKYGVVDAGADIRLQQIDDLITTWEKRPLFGWGDGANSSEVIRSNVSGFYEMVYFAKLMQRGIVGVIIYLVLFFLLYYRMFNIIKTRTNLSTDCYVVLVGLTGMLVANATNPYIEAFDKLIIIFIPVLLIKLYNHSLNRFQHKSSVLFEARR